MASQPMVKNANGDNACPSQGEQAGKDESRLIRATGRGLGINGVWRVLLLIYLN